MGAAGGGKFLPSFFHFFGLDRRRGRENCRVAAPRPSPFLLGSVDAGGDSKRSGGPKIGAPSVRPSVCNVRTRCYPQFLRGKSNLFSMWEIVSFGRLLLASQHGLGG